MHLPDPKPGQNPMMWRRSSFGGKQIRAIDFGTKICFLDGKLSSPSNTFTNTTTHCIALHWESEYVLCVGVFNRNISI